MLLLSVITKLFSFSCIAKFIIIIIIIIVFPTIVMLCFQRHKLYSFLCMVNFIPFKEMLQNTQQLVQKGTDDTAYHGNSVNVICHMAQWRE